MNVGIKFCGGCNPRYDRVRFFKILERSTPHTYSHACEEVIYDCLIIINGCTSACGSEGELKAKVLMRIDSTSTLEHVISRLRDEQERI